MINKGRIQALKNNTLVRYIAIGGTTYFIELISMYSLVTVLNNPITAVGISFWIGIAVSFLLQKIIAFKNHDQAPRMLARQMVAFSLLVIMNYVFTLVVVGILTNLTGLFIARTVALLITTCWNFIIYKKIIFKN